MKAREWMERGSTSKDSFDALSNYWRGFNNLFAGLGQERDLISKFLQSTFNEDFAQSLLDAHAQAAKELLSAPVIDMRGNGKDTSQHIENFEAANTAMERLITLFMIIYQVRCNFEHGQNSPNRERDQMLCAAACSLLKDVVRNAT